MYHSLLENSRMTLEEKKRIIAILNETKIKEKEIFDLLKKYCNMDYKEALNIMQNEKFINVPCRRLEEFLLLEKGYSYKEVDLFINNHVINILANNPELSKVTPSKLYDLAKEHEKIK